MKQNCLFTSKFILIMILSVCSDICFCFMDEWFRLLYYDTWHVIVLLVLKFGTRWWCDNVSFCKAILQSMLNHKSVKNMDVKLVPYSLFLIVFKFAECRFAECWIVQCRFADCLFVKCRFTECGFGECRFAEYRIAECQLAQCRLAECQFAECRFA